MREEIQPIIEGILFAAGDAVALDRLQMVLDIDMHTLEEALSGLANMYDFDRRGIMLVRLEDKVQLCSRPDYAEYIRRATESRRPPSLSPAALEVLSIVAYRQPVTRAFIEQVRGVDSSNTVSMLSERGLIEECGRLDVPGRPMLFRTTPTFLRTFSISSLTELPELPELTGMEGEQLKIRLDKTDGEPSAQTADEVDGRQENAPLDHIAGGEAEESAPEQAEPAEWTEEEPQEETQEAAKNGAPENMENETNDDNDDIER